MHHNCSDLELKLSQYMMKVSILLLNCVISLDATALISGSSDLESPH